MEGGKSFRRETQMSHQGNPKKFQHGVVGNASGNDRKRRQDDGISVSERIENKSCAETALGDAFAREKQWCNGGEENGECSLSLATTKAREIKKSPRCLFKVKKQIKDDGVLLDDKSLVSDCNYDQPIGKALSGGVEDLRISMVTGGNLEHFIVENEVQEEAAMTGDAAGDKQETKLYIAVPVSLSDEVQPVDQWQLEDQLVDLNESKNVNLEQVAMTERDGVDCSPMRLTFSGSGQELMLMTPQELERMPESGIEFEESVGPKETLSVSESAVESCADGGADAEAGTLATISISTDRDTDTTSIVINTKQGQQAFKINTTDLMQAAATLQPIMLADLVKEHAGEVFESFEASNQEEFAAAAPSTKVISFPSAGCIQDEKNGTGLICTHTGRCKKAWTCPECGKLFNKQCKLKVHMMMHAGCRPFKCTVDGCDWTFTSVYKLNRHQESHCSAKEFRCDFEGCDRSFTTVYNLNSHKKIHAQPNIVSCPIDNCNLKFQTRRKMQLHLREHEGVEAPYKCSVESCGKTYYSANSMASHLRVHKNNRLQCTFEGCDKVFDRMSRYKTHVWKHTGERPYMCTYEGCSWAFSSASKLKRHMRKHTGERQYTCKEPGCGKSFLRLEHLQGHVITHSGDKPFHCPHQNCDARFTAKSSLYVHLKKHRMNGEKMSHPCPVETCGKRYNCKSSLRIHMLRYHSNNTTPDVNMMSGITLIAADEGESHTIIPDDFQQEGLVTIAVSQSEDGTGLLTDTVETNLVEAPEFLLAPVIDEGTVVNSNELETELIYPPDSSSLVLTSPCPSSSTELILPSALAAASSEMDPLGLLCVLQANNSGSARTDYCCNHLLTNRSRKRRRQQQQKQQQDEMESESVSEAAVASNDVILSSTAFQTPAADPTNILYLPNTLLPDDAPPSHGELYQEDGLLSSMAKDLAVPISLLTEQSNGHGDFTGTTINLQDLE